MANTENVLKALRFCSSESCPGKECPYWDDEHHGTCQIRLHEDAYTLLQEVEDDA